MSLRHLTCFVTSVIPSTVGLVDFIYERLRLGDHLSSVSLVSRDPYVSVVLSHMGSHHMSLCYRDGYDGHSLRDTFR